VCSSLYTATYEASGPAAEACCVTMAPSTGKSTTRVYDSRRTEEEEMGRHGWPVDGDRGR
jgi:hypothetical protein